MFEQWRGKLNKFLAIMVFSSPLIVVICLIHYYAVNVPFSDDYALIPMLKSVNHGHVPWGLFWAQHNEHRIFFPNVILTTMAKLTHWNVPAILYLSAIIAGIGFLGLVLIIRRHIHSLKFSCLAILLSTAIFFSPAQSQNWLWDWQLEWFFCVTCVIWSVYFIDKLKRQGSMYRLIIPGLLAFIATFSLAGGFFTWLGGLIILLSRKFKPSWVITWLVAAIVSLWLYYFHYLQPKDGFTQGVYLHHIPSVIKYFLAYIGRPTSSNSHAAIIVGLCLLLLFFVATMFTLYKHQFKEMSAVISLGLISIFVGLTIGIARFSFGITGALSSVHTTFSIMFTTSVVILVIHAASSINFRKTTYSNLLLLLLAVMFMPIVLSSWISGITDMRSQHQTSLYIYDCSHKKNPTDFCLYELDPVGSQQAANGLSYLKQRGYGGY